MPYLFEQKLVAKFELIKFHGRLVPLFAGEGWSWIANAGRLSKALKRRDTLLAKCKGVLDALGDPSSGKFREQSREFLRSKDALLAGMWDANSRRSIDQRHSIRQLIAASEQFDVLKVLNEPVRQSYVPKSDGTALRQINDFGPVARGAAHLCIDLIALTFAPKAFQFPGESPADKIRRALTCITEGGCTHVAEIDIINHYGSFDGAMLEASLPLPKAATREIILAKSAPIGGQQVSTPPFSQSSPSGGLPQGGVASNKVAEWSVSFLEVEHDDDVVLMNHADNFFLFAKSEKALAAARNSLGLAITKLPGGNFTGKEKQFGTCDTGFRMLGCHFYPNSAGFDIEPSEKMLKKFEGEFNQTLERADELLSQSKAGSDIYTRYMGVNEFVRAKSMLVGWENAYGFCGEFTVLATSDLRYFLNQIRKVYAVTEAEENAVKDPYTRYAFDPYGWPAPVGFGAIK